MDKFESLIKDIVTHKIQLDRVYLVELEVKNHLMNYKEHMQKLQIEFDNSANILSSNKSEAILKVKVYFKDIEEQPFTINIEYRGICSTDEEITEEELHSFAEWQSIPLLWPYVRQALSDTMTKMNIPPILLPTLDVIKTLYKKESKSTVEKENA